MMVTEGPVADQVALAVGELVRRGALGPGSATEEPLAEREERDGAAHAAGPGSGTKGSGRIVAVLAEPGRPEVGRELLGAAATLADEIGGAVHALCPGNAGLVSEGADVVVVLDGSVVAEDVADAVASYVRDVTPWAVLAPSTAFGREVAGRAAAATGSGLVGDAIGLSASGGVLIAAKPAFAGALVADITCRSPVQMVTVRPGVLPARTLRRGTGEIVTHPVATRGRVEVLGEQRNDDVETLARADVVIGVGQGVAPDQYELLSPLAALLGAELAATRKVTDKGWAPRARQVGITGRSVSPRLYIGIGLSGKFNHLVGVRAAGTIVAVNTDRQAPVFEHCDIGIVGDWREVVPLLQQALRRAVANELSTSDEAPVG